MMLSQEEIKKRLQEAIHRTKSNQGEIATYIPELATVDPDNFGMALIRVNGEEYIFGDETIRFSMQSISKVISLILALMDQGLEKVYEKVGTEPTKYEFNSLIPIDDRASNPMINAGAITTSSLIAGNSSEEQFDRILRFVRILSHSDKVRLMEKVYQSELKTTDRNRAIAYYLRSKGIFTEEAEEVLDLYVKNCSIGVNIRELATIAAILANRGRDLKTGKELIPREIVKIAIAQMASCGMYEDSGRYLMEVGLPAKSGVSGAIMAIAPGKCGICTYSPRLDSSGNSVRGIKILKEISKTLDINIFL
ncbi:MAG: glutaminase A [Tissierellia bacterium]|nr:glutaminase A [Tissierellia bacterium]